MSLKYPQKFHTTEAAGRGLLAALEGYKYDVCPRCGSKEWICGGFADCYHLTCKDCKYEEMHIEGS